MIGNKRNFLREGERFEEPQEDGRFRQSSEGGKEIFFLLPRNPVASLAQQKKPKEC